MTSARPRRSEAGTTLVEVLITVMILGVGFVAILGGMGTSFGLSALHREQARVETEVRRYAETLKKAAYVNSCAADAYAGVAFAAGTGYTVAPPKVVSFLDEATGAPVASCTTADPALHVVELSVASTRDDRAVETMTIVKRSP